MPRQGGKVSEFWLGVITLPLITGLGIGVFYGLLVLRMLANKVFAGVLMKVNPIRDGETVQGHFVTRTQSNFGGRSAMAASAMAARKVWLFEPLSSFGIFIMLDIRANGKRVVRARRAIEQAYDQLLHEEQNPAPDKEFQ